MHRTHRYVIAAGALVVASSLELGCQGTKLPDDANDSTPGSGTSTGALASESSDDSPTESSLSDGGVQSNTTQLKLVPPGRVGLGNVAQKSVRLYGYDQRIPEHTPSLLRSLAGGAPELPATVTFPHPWAPHTLISSPMGPVPAQAAAYFFVTQVDINGDGRICPYEYFDAAPEVFLQRLPSTAEVILTQVPEGGMCVVR